MAVGYNGAATLDMVAVAGRVSVDVEVKGGTAEVAAVGRETKGRAVVFRYTAGGVAEGVVADAAFGGAGEMESGAVVAAM